MLPDTWGSPEDYATAMGRPEERERPDEPVTITIALSFPDENSEVIVEDWPSAALVMAPWLDRRGCMIRVSPDEDGNVWIQLRYQPTRQEVEFHCGLHEFAEEGR